MTDRTPIRVLFIDDSPADAELALRTLDQDGFDVSWRLACSEGELQHVLSSWRPQLVLSDFCMPGFDGARALCVVQKMAPAVPFIFVSGAVSEERAIESIRMGATDYVMKDNMRRLGTAVRRAMAEAAERQRTFAAQEERARLVEILEATSDYVCMFDPEGRLIYLNAAGSELIGISKSAAIGKPIDEFHPQWVNEIIESEARPTAARDGLWQGETAIRQIDGTEIPVSQVLIAHRDPSGEIRFFSTVARDMRERWAYEERIQYFANYDPLTRLPNRDLLRDRTAQAIAHARRIGRTVALLVLGLDRFKLVNEGYGHATGDGVLRSVASSLENLVREGDTVARLGADVFAVLASDLARPHDALVVARKIGEAIRAPLEVEGRSFRLTVSVGVSVYPRDGANFDILLRNADAARHRVKLEGRNGFQFYTVAMTREVADQLELENELRLALGGGELEIHFQPQIGLRDGRIVGVEALMRWRHKTRGWISPDRFIPIAEDSDLIHQLGELALEVGCRQVKGWNSAGLTLLRLAVNVSARQFRSPDFIDVVSRALHAAGLEPSRLELEITESMLVENRGRAIAILDRLKALGVQIAVDDFGTGYSSLSYLSRLPIDCLKIDRSFVARVTERGRDAAIAQAIISLARSLDLRVVAEGVETSEQLAFLLSHRCEEGQGYLFSPPVTASAIAPLLSAGSLPAAEQFARQKA